MNDQNTNISKLKEIVQAFCEARDWDQFHTPKALAIGLSTEASELLELFRFKGEEEIKLMFQSEKKREQMGEEMADSLYFLLRFAQKYEFDLVECLTDKLEKNNARYPVEKSRGSNKKYTEL